MRKQQAPNTAAGVRGVRYPRRGRTAATMEFVNSVLSSSCRPKEHEKAVSTKLRGKRLLLENVRTVAPGEIKKRRKQPAKQAAPPVANRKRRRALLLEAVAQVTYEQLLPQHTAWLAYAEAELRSAPAASEPSAVLAQLDWHGARVRVDQSPSVPEVNTRGLVLSETRRMLLLLNESTRAWVPKTGRTLEITLPDGSTALCEAARAYPT